MYMPISELLVGKIELDTVARPDADASPPTPFSVKISTYATSEQGGELVT